MKNRSFIGSGVLTLSLGLTSCASDFDSPEDDAGRTREAAVAPCTAPEVLCAVGTTCIPVKVIRAKGDSSENDACNQIAEDIRQSSTLFQTRGYSLRFRPSQGDYEERNDTLLNDDCTLPPGLNLATYTDENVPPPCDLNPNDKQRLSVADQFASKAVIYIARGHRPAWSDAVGHWVMAPYSNYSGPNGNYVIMLASGHRLTVAHELGHYLHLGHTFVGNYLRTPLSMPPGPEDPPVLADAMCNLVNAGWSFQSAFVELTDGDRQDVVDTNPDPGTNFYANQCTDPALVNYTVTCGAQTGTVVVNPDRGNIMSYYDKSCGGTRSATLSASQASTFQAALNTGNRRSLTGGTQWLGLLPSITRTPGGNLHMTIANGTGGMWFQNIAPGAAESQAFQYFGGDLAEEQTSTIVVDGQIHVFGRTNTGAIRMKTWSGSGWLPSATGWSLVGTGAASRPVVVSWGSGRLDVFVRLSSDKIGHRALQSGTWTPSSGWEDLGGSTTGEPSVVSWGPNRLDLVARGSDGAVHRKAWVGSWWPSPTSWSTLGGATTDSPTIVSWGVDRLDIIARGTDGSVQYKNWNGTAWSPSETTWTSIGGSIVGSPSIVSWGPNRLDLVARGSNDAVWRKVWTGSWWPSATTWESMGGSAARPPVIYAEGVNQLRYYTVAQDRNLYARRWTGTAWEPATGWTYIGRE
jgi:hypothetical protein